MPLCFCSCFAGSPVLLQNELIFESLETVECWLGPFPSLSRFGNPASELYKNIERYHPLVSSTSAPETWGYDYTPNQALHNFSELDSNRLFQHWYVNNLFQVPQQMGNMIFALYIRIHYHIKIKVLLEVFAVRCLMGCSGLFVARSLVDWQRIPVTSSPAVCKKSLEAKTSIR